MLACGVAPGNVGLGSTTGGLKVMTKLRRLVACRLERRQAQWQIYFRAITETSGKGRKVPTLCDPWRQSPETPGGNPCWFLALTLDGGRSSWEEQEVDVGIADP